jgi:hypothetical protein
MEEFQSTSPPVVLDYSRAKPLGYKAVQKLTRFFPLTSLPNTDLVRFIINSQGYWDPYSSYLRFTVRVKSSTAGIPGTNLADAGSACQLDSSASSFIQTMSFIQNGVELERIDRYEVLSSILNDMFYSKEQRMQRAHEGFGIGMPHSLKYQDGANGSQASGQCTLTEMSSAFNNSSSQCIGGIPEVRCNAILSGLSGASHLCQGEIETSSPYFDGSNEPMIWGPSGSGAMDQYTFCIPILSGIFGVLMPADEVKYIPMQFFPNLEMNFRLNPYAMHNLNPSLGAGSRNFEIISCELFVNIIHFAPEVNNAVADIVKERGLYLHTCSYYYGPSHMIPPLGSLETYPINMSFKSLRSLVWCFMPTNYRSKAYVRELRRKALSCTSAQVRIGGDLFPTFPIGSGGSATSSNRPNTNSDFIVNTYKAFGRLHDTVNDSLVTSHTFCSGNTLGQSVAGKDEYSDSFMDAIGSGIHWPSLVRGFNISKGAFMEPGTSPPTGIADNSNSIFMDCRKNNFLINQIVPRAVYGIDLDTITSDDSVISGVNTLINKPFELLLEGTNDTKDSCELNMFLYYDLVIMIDKDYTIKYLGRGG